VHPHHWKDYGGRGQIPAAFAKSSPSSSTSCRYPQTAPLVSSIQQNITNSTKMIADLPSVAIEALLDFSKEQHRNDHARTELDKAYKEIRAAYLKYAEVALREARERERRLFYGITGLASVEDFGAPTAPVSPDN
jgi:hypothetical protein